MVKRGKIPPDFGKKILKFRLSKYLKLLHTCPHPPAFLDLPSVLEKYF
jgi:hypothetical protein